MSAAYERLFAESFSQRTLLAAGYLIAVYISLQAVLSALGGHLDWFSFSFYIRNAFSALPFIAALLARLRPVARPEENSGLRIINLGNLLSLGCWILASVTFSCSYFNRFAPSFLSFYSYPEGKYGPPLLREQPFFVTSFAVFLALVGYIKLEWRQRSSIEYHLDEVPSLIKLAILRFNSSWRRLLYVFSASYLLLFAENLVLVPHTWVGYSIFIGVFRTIRRGPHSFWEFLDLRLAYHLVWFGTALLLLFLSIEIIVEALFGRCFHLCRGLRAPNAILLSGLQSKRAAVRGQALLELRHLATHESVWRASLFRDFIGEDATSRLLCQYFIKYITEFSSHLQLLNEDLKHFSQEFEQKANDLDNESTFRRASIKDEIFSPRKRNILEQILDKGEKLSRPSTPPKEDNKSKLLPGILEVKPRTTLEKQSTSPTPLKTAKYHNGYMRLILLTFGRFAKFFPGRVYAGLACEIVKSWWLGDVEMITWTVDALSAFVVASYDEDCHGQVQFVMNDILYSLSELLQVLTKFEQLPIINGRRMLDDLFGATTPSPTENQARRVSTRTMGALESILDKFADSMDQLKISTQTKEMIRELGLAL